MWNIFLFLLIMYIITGIFKNIIYIIFTIKNKKTCKCKNNKTMLKE